MKIHLRADDVNERHIRFTVFINGANCGQLTMLSHEAFNFHQIVSLGCCKEAGDDFVSSSHWLTEEQRLSQEKELSQ